MNKKIYLLILIQFLCIVVKAQSKDELAESINAVISDKTSKIYYKSSKIPKCLIKEINQILDDKFTISSSHQAYRKFDKIEVENKGLPTRRLIFLLKNKWNYFFCYEKGGYGYSIVLVFCNIYKRKVNTLYSLSSSANDNNSLIPNEKLESQLSIDFIKNIILKRNFIIIYNNGGKVEKTFVPF